MFSFKLADFMHRPVVWETRVVDAAPPSITICPSRLNISSLEDAQTWWERGSFTTEEVLQEAATSGTEGRQISPYHLVQGGLFQEVLLTQIGMAMVDRPRQHCRPEEDYDVNQCLLDCRSLAAFTESNCSVQWGATSGGGLPACVSRAEYEAAVRAWQRARPDCDHCLRPCQTQLIEVKSPPAIQGNASSAIDIKLRFSPERLSVRQRLAYELVDLLSDLGGAFGLLLGYSLMSLVDLLDAAVGWNERRRRRRAAPEGWR
ncbi:hypothetical protein FJT64_014622 [Amphibalanus amphitrite]|uniref:Uncharacterized protein n=1 Tax=Amphibalanus amphitrite TaxID=1232801 RepID=A0A6A4V882_AMPAM|nr:hypothetical protein FJT64_014622 [Amphibalanus amphitrite]